VLKERGKSIVPDLVDFLKKHIVPLKKGEVIKGKPVKRCYQCKKVYFMCDCWRLEKRRF
tara:strand:+ start:2957 stop:3133 length:177 start_codon:yes stop_codon:yes gene_type:complete